MKIAHVLYPDFTALDLVGPYEVISRWPDAEVHFLARSLDPMRGDRGLTVIPTDTPKTLPAPDLIVVPGSQNPVDARLGRRPSASTGDCLMLGSNSDCEGADVVVRHDCWSSSVGVSGASGRRGRIRAKAMWSHVTLKPGVLSGVPGRVMVRVALAPERRAPAVNGRRPPRWAGAGRSMFEGRSRRPRAPPRPRA